MLLCSELYTCLNILRQQVPSSMTRGVRIDLVGQTMMHVLECGVNTPE
jgi:hypothetical protein